MGFFFDQQIDQNQQLIYNEIPLMLNMNFTSWLPLKKWIKMNRLDEMLRSNQTDEERWDCVASNATKIK